MQKASALADHIYARHIDSWLWKRHRRGGWEFVTRNQCYSNCIIDTISDYCKANLGHNTVFFSVTTNNRRGTSQALGTQVRVDQRPIKVHMFRSFKTKNENIAPQICPHTSLPARTHTHTGWRYSDSTTDLIKPDSLLRADLIVKHKRNTFRTSSVLLSRWESASERNMIISQYFNRRC